MTFADLLRGESVFLDANTLVYHFQPHPIFGPACQQKFQRYSTWLRMLSRSSTP